MKINKLYRLCISLLVFLSSIIASMLLLKIPVIAQLLSPENVYSASGIWLWILFWLIIALECAIIPGPYIPFLLFFAATPLASDKLLFWIICTSAVAVGRIGAYFVGKCFGNKLLKWVAEESYQDWQAKLNSPTGKTTYAITVVAPGFPDFMLAWVAGSIEMNFWFYMLINTVCKAIENLLLIYLGVALSGGGDVWFYIYLLIIVISSIVAIILKIIIRNRDKLER
jgi:uncharacterized membrane protein YdjX (TVP38/TMEM64 family)